MFVFDIPTQVRLLNVMGVEVSEFEVKDMVGNSALPKRNHFDHVISNQAQPSTALLKREPLA